VNTVRFAFVGRRLIQAVPVVLAVTLLVFLLTKITPGDPARTILGPKATTQQVAKLSHELGYDRGVVAQYLTFLGHLLQGNLGASVRTGQPVSSVLSEHLAPTVWLVLASASLTALGAVPLAWAAATHRDGWLDHALRSVSIVVLYVPTFWIGLVLVRFVALPSGWFPVSGFGDGAAGHLRSVVLPAVSLSLALAPVIARSLRSSMVDVLDSDFVGAARAVGVRGWRLFRWYVLRNALPPAISLLAVQVSFLLFGVVVLEMTFDIDGLGSQLVTSAVAKDLPVTQGITLIFALAVVSVNLLADVALAGLDPRVRIS
jgi:peptide/nickel transport system permease protein